MASIEQVAGELNIVKIYQGDSFNFSTRHTGDITADTFIAVIENNDNDITIPIVKTYSSVTLKTTLAYTLNKENSVLLYIGNHQWKLTQYHGDDERTIINGTWGVYQA